jgi:signal peptidase I
MSVTSGTKTESGVGETIRVVIHALLIALVIRTFLFQPFNIPSGSMKATLLVGDYLLVDKSLYAGAPAPLVPYREVARGDIVVFHYPLHPETYFVKRVVGVPGDRVRMIDKQLFVNGKLEAASYVAHVDPYFDAYRDNFPELRFAPGNVDGRWWLEMHRATTAAGELVVPAGSYFVLGDNRDNSLDSRYWGFVPDDHIKGRAFLVWMNFSDFKRIGNGIE